MVDWYGFEWTAVLFSLLYCIAIAVNYIELGHTFFIQKEPFLIKKYDEYELIKKFEKK